MPKCNYCDREVPEILQPEIDQGWGEVTLAYTDANGKPVKEERIAHCPDHLQEAFNTVIGRVAQVQGLCIGIGLKHSIPLCGLINQHFLDHSSREIVPFPGGLKKPPGNEN